LTTPAGRSAVATGPFVLALGLAFGYLAAGFVGLLLAAASILCTVDERPRVRSSVGWSAVALMGIAAVATIFEGSRVVSASFATDRGIASMTSRFAAIQAAVLLAGRIVEHAGTEEPLARRASPAPATPAATPRPGFKRVDLLTSAIVAVGVLVRVVAGPVPLGALAGEIASNVEQGLAYGRGVPPAVTETALLAPAAPIIGGLAPFGPRFALLVAGAIAAFGVVLLARRHGTVEGGLAAAAIIALLPSWWGQQLPEALAVAGIAWAWLLLERPEGRREVFGAGLCLGLATLARPEVALAVPLVVVWRWRAASPSRAALVVVGFALVFGPWQLWVTTNFGTPLPTTSVGLVMEAASADDVRGGDRLGSVAPVAVPALGSEGEAQREAFGRVFDRGARLFDPRLLLARVLRGMDLWDPSANAVVRKERGSPFPGGEAGGVVEAVAMLGAAAMWLDRWRRKNGRWSPLVTLPVVGVAVLLLSYGDRANRTISLPATTVLLAVALTATLRRLRSSPSDHEDAVPCQDLAGER
jgi:hypothetical protein